jgi:hexosaminidase
MRISLASSTVVFLAGSLALAQAPSSTRTSFSLMPVPSSITRGEGTFTVTPAGGGPSTFTYNYGQTHDARLEAAVRRDLVRLGRTCGGEVLRSTIDHPSPAQASLLINVTAPGEAVQTMDEDESYQLSVTTQGATLTAANDLGAMHGLETL